MEHQGIVMGLESRAGFGTWMLCRVAMQLVVASAIVDWDAALLISKLPMSLPA